MGPHLWKLFNSKPFMHSRFSEKEGKKHFYCNITKTENMDGIFNGGDNESARVSEEYGKGQLSTQL